MNFSADFFHTDRALLFLVRLTNLRKQKHEYVTRQWKCKNAHGTY